MKIKRGKEVIGKQRKESKEREEYEVKGIKQILVIIY